MSQYNDFSEHVVNKTFFDLFSFFLNFFASHYVLKGVSEISEEVLNG